MCIPGRDFMDSFFFFVVVTMDFFSPSVLLMLLSAVAVGRRDEISGQFSFFF